MSSGALKATPLNAAFGLGYTSRRDAVIVVQQSAQSFLSMHGSAGTALARVHDDNA